MSGILKPLMHTTNTITPSDAIGVDHVVSVSTVDSVATGTGGAENYLIVFTMNAAGGQTTSEVIWRYATDTLRDADLVLLLIQASDVL